MLRLILLAFAVGGGAALPPPRECRTSLFGAQPSQSLYSTDGLQAALDYCKETCGTVIVDKQGVYLTGALRLTDCVHLEVPEGVTLLAGNQRNDYPGDQNSWYLLRFEGCSRCSLSGGGTIDGGARNWVLPTQPSEGDSQGRRLKELVLNDQLTLGHAGEDSEEQAPKAVRNWQDPSCSDPKQCRPRLVGVIDSTDVAISGVTLADSVYTALQVYKSNRVAVTGVAIRGDRNIRFTDGMVVDGSRYVNIKASNVDVAGNALAIKTTHASQAAEHVDVSGCRLRSRSAGVLVGEPAAANIRYVSFSDLTIDDSARGLAVQLRDSASISHISFKQVTLSTKLSDPRWWGGAAEAISVTALPRDAATNVGAVFAVSFKDVHASGENGIFLAGGPMGIDRPGQRRPSKDYSLSVISLERVSVKLVKRSNFPGGCQDYRPSRESPAGTGASGEWWPSGLDCSHGGTAPIWVSGVQRSSLKTISVEHTQPARKDWLPSAWVDPFSTFEVQVADVVVTRELAGVAEE